MLTHADKLWLRKMVREEFASIVEGLASEQLGGYDGATPVEDEDEDSEYRKRIGFTVNEQASPKCDD